MDEEDQQHKKHNSTRLKLKKKRQQQKELKKEKSRKKKEYDREKAKEIFFGKKLSKKEAKEQHKDKYKINQKKLQKWLQKFVKINTDDISEFLDIFQNLDEGEEVDISELENTKVKKILQKLFKTIKLTEKKLVFTKGKKCKVENLYEYMAKKHQEMSKEEDSDSEDEDSESNSGSDSENEGEKQLNQQQKQQIQQSVMPSQVGPSIGPSMGPSVGPSLGNKPVDENQEELDQFKKEMEQIAEKKHNPNRDDWMQGDFDDFMSSNFKGQVQNNLKSFLNKRQKPVEQQQKSSKEFNNYAEGSARLDEPDGMSKDKMQQFMAEYNQTSRKSLMEIHQEKLKQQKEQKSKLVGGAGNERKTFDRKKDMEVNRIDTKRLFSALKDRDVLSTKFASSFNK